MATVITVMNMKGGVGKTTVALNVGGILGSYPIAGKRQRVLLIDYDPQFNLSQAYLPIATYVRLEGERKTSLSILQDDETKIDPFRVEVPGHEAPPKPAELAHSIKKNLDIIASTLDLMYVALGHSAVRITPFIERFTKFVAKCRRTYDVILIDCHPAGSILTKTSLQNSDHVLIPVAPESYAVRGIGLMLELIRAIRPTTARPTPHILFNRVPRIGTTAEEMRIRASRDFAGLCLTQTLKRYKAFADPMGGAGFVWQSTAPYSTQAFANLMSVTHEIADRTDL